MKQFILAARPEKNKVRLDGDDYKYLVRVRRLAVGETFPAVLPNGEETLIKILSIDGGVLTGELAPLQFMDLAACGGSSFSRGVPAGDADRDKAFSAPIPPIILFQALPKADKMDLIVRQAAEGGVSEVVPFISEYSVAKVNASGQKFTRWERIVKEARQQSGSKIATKIFQPLAFSGLFDYWNELRGKGAIGLLFHHKGLENKSLHGYLNSVPKAVVPVIGPEGGFSDSEVNLFLENGFKPMMIGGTILRTETAALYCTAAIKTLLLERNSWDLKQTKTCSV